MATFEIKNRWTDEVQYTCELPADGAGTGGGGMNRIARFAESWAFVALCWAALIAYAVFGGAV